MEELASARLLFCNKFCRCYLPPVATLSSGASVGTTCGGPRDTRLDDEVYFSLHPSHRHQWRCDGRGLCVPTRVSTMTVTPDFPQDWGIRCVATVAYHRALNSSVSPQVVEVSGKHVAICIIDCEPRF